MLAFSFPYNIANVINFFFIINWRTVFIAKMWEQEILVSQTVHNIIFKYEWIKCVMRHSLINIKISNCCGVRGIKNTSGHAVIVKQSTPGCSINSTHTSHHHEVFYSSSVRVNPSFLDPGTLMLKMNPSKTHSCLRRRVFFRWRICICIQRCSASVTASSLPPWRASGWTCAASSASRSHTCTANQPCRDSGRASESYD